MMFGLLTNLKKSAKMRSMVRMSGMKRQAEMRTVMKTRPIKAAVPRVVRKKRRYLSCCPHRSENERCHLLLEGSGSEGPAKTVVAEADPLYDVHDIAAVSKSVGFDSDLLYTLYTLCNNHAAYMWGELAVYRDIKVI